MTFSIAHTVVRTFLISSNLSLSAPLWAEETPNPLNANAIVPAINYQTPYAHFRAANESPQTWQNAFNTPTAVGSAAPVVNHHHEQQATGDTAKITNSHDGEGVVMLLSADGTNIKVKHGVIKKLAMPAMTMTYRVANPQLLRGLSVGDHIGFDIEEQGDDYLITAIVRKEH